MKRRHLARMKLAYYFSILGFSLLSPCLAQEEPASKPIELQVLKDSIGVWDAKIEVWPKGLDAPSITFTGVETNRAYGAYWIASDFDSEFGGQTTKVHSIVGYDLEEGRMVGKVIDDGPYAARMTGDYDRESKTTRWRTEVKDPSGKLIVQKTLVTQKSADQRVLVLSVENKAKAGFVKFMQITFVRRK